MKVNMITGKLFNKSMTMKKVSGINVIGKKCLDNISSMSNSLTSESESNSAEDMFNDD
jgi:hypothetical protein